MTLYNADCLEVMRGFSSESFDLIYLDPPFYTQKVQRLSDRNGKKYEFPDIWNSLSEYLEYMKARIFEMKRVLKSTGGLFLHCDVSASHHLRKLLDDVFGEGNFQSEIIWSFKRWSNSRKGLISAHQTIFYYTKGKDFKFNTLYGNYSATTNLDQILQERERDESGKAVYKRDEHGQIVAAKEKRGVPLSDVWEIPFLNPKAKERTGYPTQKPIELLDRIVQISTDKGDLVLDPFCGSGTTLVSAKLLERKYVGIDVNKDAIEIANERLQNPFKTNSILLQVGEGAYQTKTEEELSILRQFDCEIVQRNRGIDALLKKHYDGRPVALKIQKENESFANAVALLHSATVKKNCSYGVLIARKKEEALFANLPLNIVVINRYDVQLEMELTKRTESATRQSKPIQVRLPFAG